MRLVLWCNLCYLSQTYYISKSEAEQAQFGLTKKDGVQRGGEACQSFVGTTETGGF